MSAHSRSVYCDRCGKLGGAYGPRASGRQRAGLRRFLATERGWTWQPPTPQSPTDPVGVREDRCPDCREKP